MKNLILLSALCLAVLSSCKKDPEPEVIPEAVTPALNKTILTDFSTNVAGDAYAELAARTLTLYNNTLALQADVTDANLTLCKQNWKDARLVWEQGEAFLFGPVSTENIDPRIDTWPVNFTDLDGELLSSAVFTQDYINGLQDPLKGFHPTEYLLFGQNGNKTAAELTARQLEYLVALTQNIKDLTAQLNSDWGPYGTSVHTAGTGSVVYPTRVSAFEELVNAMIGICDEVANGKMYEPFIAGDASLEESPFAFNSIIDFTNNIKGVEVVYKGKFETDGHGLEDMVRVNNLSLDAEVKLAITNAVGALQSITVPFGQAITEQPVQVQNAIDAINTLAATLENDLLPYVQVYGN